MTTPSWKVSPFRAAEYVVRVRRLADVSQRELAAAAGLSQPVVTRIENDGPVAVATLVRILDVARLRLAVLDEDGREVAPFPSDAVRDNAGRRFPAHLDVQPPDVLPYEAIASPRYDRKPPRGWYHRRAARNFLRTAAATPPDHPTVGELADRALRRVRDRMPPEFERPLPFLGTVQERPRDEAA
ncbi:transcriptional regulator, XRE family [Beutenbergia cavernae DSM 12333]|uniref:Transcriptional regulator, XRE family n=1 Tax=Beutenbergia cavernae (strain ATCC BAA-8 / DSM 12333 / CCUG 43141 / JCM 11478 / NBRC 16432 / NCIMB 13614 / HKI 0122) TaxID=471853 RepID=C5C340_BEUC1|nr:helix-turn-helix domain-containing protein [Beutenbergia cavernae]ACQ81884.1 transcriptional regulator, XRE family [Beutenbergia cavernae DSM 12333]